MTAAVILAAGASARRAPPPPRGGGPHGRTFLEALAAGLRRGGLRGPIFVVTGARRTRVAAEAQRLGLRPVHNRRHRAGQLTSAYTGLRVALAAGARLVLILPCDMPHLKSATVAAVLGAMGPSRASFRRRPGHPLGLDAASARRILAGGDAASLREAMARAQVRPRSVAVADPAALQNVNREAELRRWDARVAPASKGPGRATRVQPKS